MVMTYNQTLTMTLFDVIQYYLIISKLSTGTIKIKKSHILCALLFIMTIGTSAYLIDDQYSYFISTVLLASMNFILYRKNIVNLIYSHLSTIIILLTTQFTIIIIMSLIMGGITYNFTNGIIAQTTGIGLIILMVRFLPINIIYDFIRAKNHVFRVISINIFIMLTFLAIYWFLDISGLLENLIIITALIFIIIYVNFIFLKNGLKNKFNEDQIKIYEEYLPIIDELIDELRIKQHDFDNHLAAMKMLVGTNTGEAISKVGDYLKEVEDEYENSDLIKLHNKVLAGFLYSKQKYANKQNIDMDIIIDNYFIQTHIKDYVLIDMVGILIDNAFETGVKNNQVKVYIFEENKKSVIEIVNKHPYLPTDKINNLFKKGYSTKNKTSRGIGLYKLSRCVKQHQCNLEVYNKDIDDNYVVFKLTI